MGEVGDAGEVDDEGQAEVVGDGNGGVERVVVGAALRALQPIEDALAGGVGRAVAADGDAGIGKEDGELCGEGGIVRVRLEGSRGATRSRRPGGRGRARICWVSRGSGRKGVVGVTEGLTGMGVGRGGAGGGGAVAIVERCVGGGFAHLGSEAFGVGGR